MSDGKGRTLTGELLLDEKTGLWYESGSKRREVEPEDAASPIVLEAAELRRESARLAWEIYREKTKHINLSTDPRSPRERLAAIL